MCQPRCHCPNIMSRACGAVRRGQGSLDGLSVGPGCSITLLVFLFAVAGFPSAAMSTEMSHARSKPSATKLPRRSPRMTRCHVSRPGSRASQTSVTDSQCHPRRRRRPSPHPATRFDGNYRTCFSFVCILVGRWHAGTARARNQQSRAPQWLVRVACACCLCARAWRG